MLIGQRFDEIQNEKMHRCSGALSQHACTEHTCLCDNLIAAGVGGGVEGQLSPSQDGHHSGWPTFSVPAEGGRNLRPQVGRGSRVASWDREWGLVGGVEPA